MTEEPQRHRQDAKEVRLAEALRKVGRTPPVDTTLTAVPEIWQRTTRDALMLAEIDLTEDEFERAWRCLWQSAFSGGNYALDAKRVLAAAFGGDHSDG